MKDRVEGRGPALAPGRNLKIGVARGESNKLRAIRASAGGVEGGRMRTTMRREDERVRGVRGPARLDTFAIYYIRFNNGYSFCGAVVRRRFGKLQA